MLSSEQTKTAFEKNLISKTFTTHEKLASLAKLSSFRYISCYTGSKVPLPRKD